MRACAENRLGASLVGISVWKTTLLRGPGVLRWRFSGCRHSPLDICTVH